VGGGKIPSDQWSLQKGLPWVCLSWSALPPLWFMFEFWCFFPKLGKSMEEFKELRPESEQDELVVEEYWLQYIDQDQLDALTEEILEELERRLCAATCQSSWPVTYRVADTANKAEFFRRLRPFYQNNRKLFGVLVTPLVQGIRVCGRFPPPSFTARRSYKLGCF
jgi:hypothetical protein